MTSLARRTRRCPGWPSSRRPRNSGKLLRLLRTTRSRLHGAAAVGYWGGDGDGGAVVGAVGAAAGVVGDGNGVAVGAVRATATEQCCTPGTADSATSS